MSYALSWSGGKDSMLALDRALGDGLPVHYLFNIHDPDTGRVRFHGVRAELIAAQAELLDIDLVQRGAGPNEFEATFASILRDLAEREVRGVIFGNIHLADVRAWYEERTTAAGFEHAEPLWGAEPADLLSEFVERGHRALIVSVDLSRGDADWLGRVIDTELVAELTQRTDIDACGERGEYHSFAFAGPRFRRSIPVIRGELHEADGHRQLDLLIEA